MTKRFLFAFIAFSALAIAPAEARYVPRPEPADGGAAFAWNARPTPFEASEAMDDNIVGASAEGEYAAIECVVARNYRLNECAIVEESRPEAGIGQALLRMTHHFRARSVDVDGETTRGRRVRLAMRYGGSQDFY
jgi:hypothetical protein